MADPLLQVEDLAVQFKTDEGIVQAVDGVSFHVQSGETIGIVGESGSGKSVTNLAIMGLVPRPPGRVTRGRALYSGQDLLTMSQRSLSHIRGNRVAMIFQDPMTSLNPFLTIADQLTEVTMLHLRHDRSTALNHAIEMLEKVGIPAAAQRIGDFPHQFSGGMRQRVMIAMALSCKPDLLIADEPTTALDVTIQAQILDLMKQLQQQEGTDIIMITHDMGVVANICHRVNVMYAGRFVEEATIDALFTDPRHPYTIGLLESIPRISEMDEQRLEP
ncbi:MAG: ABC transporter ATP-binding protein, partial [Planctomycetales bacterium]